MRQCICDTNALLFLRRERIAMCVRYKSELACAHTMWICFGMHRYGSEVVRGWAIRIIVAYCFWNSYHVLEEEWYQFTNSRYIESFCFGSLGMMHEFAVFSVVVNWPPATYCVQCVTEFNGKLRLYRTKTTTFHKPEYNFCRVTYEKAAMM